MLEVRVTGYRFHDGNNEASHPMRLCSFGASLPSERWLSVCWAASEFVVVGGSMHAWIAGDVWRREKEFCIKKVLLRGASTSQKAELLES